MIKTGLVKDAIREASYNKKRFFVTSFIIFILSIIFIGFNNSLLDAKITENMSKNENNYMDILLTSNYGYDTYDYDTFKSIKNVTGVMLSNTRVMNAKIKNKKVMVKVNSMPKSMDTSNADYINRFTLSAGRFPTTINEGVVEEKLLKRNHLSIGSLITLMPEDKYALRAKKIKIVGTFKEDLYNLDKSAKYTIYLSQNNFTSYTYENVFITVNDNKNVKGVEKELNGVINVIKNDKYNTEIETTKSEIESLKQNIEELKTDDNSKEELLDLEESLKSEEFKLKDLENADNKIVVSKTAKNSISYDEKISSMTSQSIIISILFSLITPILLSALIIKLFKSKKREVRTLLLINCSELDICLKYIVYIVLISFISILFAGIVSNTLFPIIVLKLYNASNVIVSFQIKYMLYSFLITTFISSIITVVFIHKIINNREFKLVKILKKIKKRK